jgi:CheY-like chemotaxis protein
LELRGLRILLAEDNEGIQLVLQTMLKRLGFLVDVAANGLEALQALERQLYDLILMDIMMPKLDGLQTTKAIHKRWPIGGPRIIAVTAHASRAKCLDDGMDDYLSKPVELQELAGVIRKHCPHNRKSQ